MIVSRRPKLIFSLSLATAFIAGVVITLLITRFQAPRMYEPVAADFCFLMQNNSLFVGREFVTQAEIQRGIEGAVLASPGCPERAATFDLPQNLPSKLTVALQKPPLAGSKLEISFEGTIKPLPFLFRFREHREPPPKWWSHKIIIKKVTSVEATD